MHEANFEDKVEIIRAKDPRYEREAYQFVREALEYTQEQIRKAARGRIRHISGQELLAGIRDFALHEFGPMALMLLNEWGIRTCPDFGEIVFNMIEIELLAKTEKDSRADFEKGYDFYEAFRKPFLPASKQVKSERVPAPQAAN